ncbi:Uncharacterised protein [Klebsiella pneumoniae]|nr:Uncharacterised protein [Klebsiella pneumoniae]SWA91301.1 Uncharacterised protein [Klebsiella pneumoniae]
MPYGTVQTDAIGYYMNVILLRIFMAHTNILMFFYIDIHFFQIVFCYLFPFLIC